MVVAYDIMVVEGFNGISKQIVNVYRTEVSKLNQRIRDYQNSEGYFILGVYEVRCFEKKNKEYDFVEHYRDTVDRLDNTCIDPHGF